MEKNMVRFRPYTPLQFFTCSKPVLCLNMYNLFIFFDFVPAVYSDVNKGIPYIVLKLLDIVWTI